MRQWSRLIICIALIGAILIVTKMGEGTLQATAMAAFTTSLGAAVTWLFSGTERPR
jgi:hypothetical protein